MSASDPHAVAEGRRDRPAGHIPTVRLTQLDGENIPNLALMRLAHWHRAKGHRLIFKRSALRDLFEPDYDFVYGSVILTASMPVVHRFRREFPNAIVGGTGLAGETNWNRTVPELLGVATYNHFDYSIYPNETRSVGHVQIGCRYKCKHCVVPEKEGPVKVVSRIADIWRGDPYPRDILLLDKDFFGMPRPMWEREFEEARSNDYRISLTQGINVRALTPDIAKAIASVRCYDKSFKHRRLYTAFDDVGDARQFFRGIGYLIAAGVRADTIMAYMLIGYANDETWTSILERFNLMKAAGIRVFPMPYRQLGALSKSANDLDFRRLCQFRQWVNGGVHKFASFDEYDANTKGSMKERRRYRDIALQFDFENPFLDHDDADAA